MRKQSRRNNDEHTNIRTAKRANYNTKNIDKIYATTLTQPGSPLPTSPITRRNAEFVRTNKLATRSFRHSICSQQEKNAQGKLYVR